MGQKPVASSADLNTKQQTLEVLGASACHAALVDRYGGRPISEHCLPVAVVRAWDELSGVERPVIWTAQRDREVWDRLPG